MKLQKKYINILNEYIKLYSEKIQGTPEQWITTENVHNFKFVMIDDLSFSIDDIVLDIDSNQDRWKLFTFESINVNRISENKKIMDYKSWLSGLSYKEFDKIL